MTHDSRYGQEDLRKSLMRILRHYVHLRYTWIFYVTFYVFLGKVEQGVKLNTEGMMD